MLLVSMGASIDGYICDREGRFDWSAPEPELFDVHLERTRTLGGCVLGRKLYETMLIWETDPDFPSTAAEAEFARAWTALPKVVFSRTLTSVEGNARLATGTLEEEIAGMLAAADGDVEVGGADLAGQAIELDLVDEIQIYRYPVLVGGGIPLLPPVTRTRQFRLHGHRSFDPDIMYECYRRA